RLKVVDRVRFPAIIVDLEASKKGLKAHIVERASPDEVREVLYEPDKEGWEQTWRGMWDWSVTLGSWQDVLWLEEVSLVHEPGATSEKAENEPEKDQRLVKKLEDLDKINEANPYLELYLGEAKARLGEERAAKKAYERALNHKNADYLDLLR